MRYIATTLAALALILTGCSNTPTAAPTHASTPSATVTITATPTPSPATSLPACESEDTEGSTPCFWDAKTQGNGKGHSFIWDGSKVTYVN